MRALLGLRPSADVMLAFEVVIGRAKLGRQDCIKCICFFHCVEFQNCCPIACEPDVSYFSDQRENLLKLFHLACLHISDENIGTCSFDIC